MQDKEKQTPARVTVEDLLQLKRGEQPDESYWERFDRELHEKSWQALAKPKRFSLQGLKVFGVKLAPALPLSAAAAFVVALALNHFPAYLADESEGSVYQAAHPVSTDTASAPVAGMAGDFAPQAGHQATFVVGQFETQPATGYGSDVTLVAASRPMATAPRHNVHYVGATQSRAAMMHGRPADVGIY